MTKKIKIGNKYIGGGSTVLIQSMCNTKTADADSTAAQILKLENAGCDIIRVAVPNEESAVSIGEIKKKINIPLVADIHFDYRLAVMGAHCCAKRQKVWRAHKDRRKQRLGGKRPVKKIRLADAGGNGGERKAAH